MAVDDKDYFLKGNALVERVHGYSAWHFSA
jgi:hypothetical protein